MDIFFTLSSLFLVAGVAGWLLGRQVAFGYAGLAAGALMQAYKHLIVSPDHFAATTDILLAIVALVLAIIAYLRPQQQKH